MLLWLCSAALATASSVFGAFALLAADPAGRKRCGRIARTLTAAWLGFAFTSMHVDDQDENAVAIANYGASFLLGGGLPFLPTAPEKVEALFGPAGLLRESSSRSWLRPGTHARDLKVVDLGSGDGAIVRAARRQAGFGSCLGFEINPLLAGYSWLRSRANEVIRWESMWEAALHDADVVFVHGNRPIMDDLGAKLSAELKDGALGIWNRYALPPRWLGMPRDKEYVVTSGAGVSWATSLPETSGHLLLYEKAPAARPKIAAPAETMGMAQTQGHGQGHGQAAQAGKR